MSRPLTKPIGLWARRRHLVQYLVLFLFLVAPWPIPWIPGLEHGLIKVDFEDWRVYLFGLVLVPGNLHILTLCVIFPLLALTVSASLWGKVFCGWVCPQNTFFEAFAGLQKWLKKYYPWYRQRPALWPWVDLAHSAFWGLVIAGTCLLYFRSPAPIFAGALFLSVFAWFVLDTYWLRHQFCREMCPYAFLQKSLQNQDTLFIAYENRAGNKCQTCRACEHACYVDIDIKKDTHHIDCTLCGACVDACNVVFSRQEAPSLLTFTSPKKSSWSFWGIDSGVKAFIAGLFLAFVIFFAWAIATMPSTAYRIDYPMASFRQEEIKEFPYTLRLRNLSKSDRSYSLEVGPKNFQIVWKNGVGEQIALQPFGSKTLSFRIQSDIPTEELGQFSTISFRLEDLTDDELVGEEERYFRQ